MKNTLLLLAAASAMSTSAICGAQAIPAAPEPAPAVTGNATLASDYRFRGISQTFGGPAFQGGGDYSHASGFYLGNWNSNVSGLSYPNGAGLEMDFYGGVKKSFGDLTLDVGTLYYYYHDARALSTDATTGALTGANRKLDNHELYVGAS